jgi:hypothetical protein
MHAYEHHRAGNNNKDKQLLAAAPSFEYEAKNKTRDAARAKAADPDCARMLNRLNRAPRTGYAALSRGDRTGGLSEQHVLALA